MRQEQKEEAVMNLLERLIEKTERRLKRIDENPDPTKMVSNRLGYELDLNEYKAQLEAWQQGKPPILPVFRMTLSRAMGFQPTLYVWFADRFVEEGPRYQQIAASMGLPDYICDYQIVGSAMCMSGDAPPPSFIVLAGDMCPTFTYSLKVLAEHFDVPQFEIDLPPKYNERSIRYVADQVGELIEFAESRVRGIKYERDRHLELMEVERIAYGYIQKEWELRKRVPCLLSNRESFRQPIAHAPSMFGEPAKALEYWRVRVEEVEERAGKGVDTEEKLRVLWVVSAPMYMDPLGLLASRGVAVPAVVTGATGFYNGKSPGFGDEKEFGRKLSPLEEEARVLLGSSWSQLGSRWVDEIIWACQDLGCEAIVNYQFTGCVPTDSLAKLVADRAEMELGVPTLTMGGKPLDSTSVSPAEFETKLTEFIDTVLAQKGRGRRR